MVNEMKRVRKLSTLLASPRDDGVEQINRTRQEIGRLVPALSSVYAESDPLVDTYRLCLEAAELVCAILSDRECSTKKDEAHLQELLSILRAANSTTRFAIIEESKDDRSCR